MPSYMLRQVPDALWARVRAYATATDQPLRTAVMALLTAALDSRAARAAGGKTVAAARTAAQRQAAARHAVSARWAARTPPAPSD